MTLPAWKVEQRSLPKPKWARHPLRWMRWRLAWVESYDDILDRWSS